jgi:3-methyladenine DNA glycosylase AlkD
MNHKKTANTVEAHLFFSRLEEALLRASNPDAAMPMRAYMKNKFDFMGIKAPVRREIQKHLWNSIGRIENPLEFAELCWSHPAREMQYAGVDFLMRSKIFQNENVLPQIQTLISDKSWWDTVDLLATRIVGGNLELFSANFDIVASWIHHPDMWLNRTAIICQLHFKLHTNLDFLSRAIVPHLSSREFFHQKAIGWALRQLSDTHPEWVKHFVATHELKPLSKREALRKTLIIN